MPIEDLKEAGGWPMIGKFRLGAPMEEIERDGKTVTKVGHNLMHFRIDLQAPYKMYDEAMIELYGVNPTTIDDVFLYGETPDEIFHFWIKQRTKTKLLHRCTGKTQVQYWDTQRNQYGFTPKDCAKNSKPACECGEHGTLRIMLPRFFQMTGRFGWFAVETSSIHNIIDVYGYLREAYKAYGNLGNIPFTLYRHMKTINVPNTKGVAGDKMRKETSLFMLETHAQVVKNLFAPQSVQHLDQLKQGVTVSAPTMLVSNVGQPAALPPTVDDIDDEDGGLLGGGSGRVYDLDRVKALSSHLFKDPVHQENLIANLRRDGKITDDMDDDEVVQVIMDNRADRAEIKWQSGEWLKESKMVQEFCSWINHSLGLTAGEMLEALQVVHTGKSRATGFTKLTGISKDAGLAACALYAANGDYDKANDYCVGFPEAQKALEALSAPTE